ncbi:porin [Hyalangium minutum]|uniref:FmdC n=1 Tax=Hyalangium minutum TaxID=394096 RepID=A0A085WIY2_9BACT|nr:porin [Hyalangium minutum]KFE67645.1 FmdC precursor [Hyalangium minutum]
MSSSIPPGASRAIPVLFLLWLGLGNVAQAQTPTDSTSTPPPQPAADQPVPAEPVAAQPAPAPPALSAPPEKPAAEKEKDKAPPSITAEPGKGVVVKAADGRYSFGIRARLQLRSTYVHFGDSDTSETQVRTIRLNVAGNVLSPDIKYTIQLAFGGNDFDTGSSSPIFDAYVDYTRFRDLNIRVGQFFVPFDRARTIREFALQFVDRQIAVRELNLDRDVGVMISSSNLFGLSDLLSYQFFLGGGDGRNRFTAYSAGPLTVLRLTVRPFGALDDDQESDLTRADKPRLAVGVAGAYNYRTSRAQSTIGTAFTAGTANYTHLAADAVFKYRGFSLLAEGLWRKANTDVLERTVNGTVTREPTRSGHGYFVQAGYLVNSELEVTARWDKLFSRGPTDPALVQLVRTQGKQLGGGLNLYLNGHAFKVQGDYFYIFGSSGVEPRHQARLQLDASF